MSYHHVPESSNTGYDEPYEAQNVDSTINGVVYESRIFSQHMSYEGTADTNMSFDNNQQQQYDSRFGQGYRADNHINMHYNQSSKEMDSTDTLTQPSSSCSVNQEVQSKNSLQSNSNEKPIFRNNTPVYNSNNNILQTKKFIQNFWVEQKRRLNDQSVDEIRDKCKHMVLPMARVKKIMRIDDNVRKLMIAADAPMFLSAASELFIQEVTALSWHVVDESRRRTMQKSDVVTALQRSDQFDFLIDLIPRDRSIKRHYNIPNQKLEHLAKNVPPNPDANGICKNSQKPTIVSSSAIQQQSMNDKNIQYVVASDQNTYNNCGADQSSSGNFTIAIDEHGNPIGDLPPGIQIIVQNPTTSDTQSSSYQVNNSDTYCNLEDGSQNHQQQAQSYTIPNNNQNGEQQAYNIIQMNSEQIRHLMNNGNQGYS